MADISTEEIREIFRAHRFEEDAVHHLFQRLDEIESLTPPPVDTDEGRGVPSKG